MSAVRDFILQTPNSNPDSLLFQFRDGSYLSRRSLASNLHALIDMCGLHSKDYNTHSFRIGAATTAAAAGIPSWLIKLLGRWRSDSYESYIHLPRATILQVPASMAAYQQNDTPINLETFDPWQWTRHVTFPSVQMYLPYTELHRSGSALDPLSLTFTNCSIKRQWTFFQYIYCLF